MNESTLSTIMAQAQVFASSWSLVGSSFASDNQLEQAEAEKATLREMIFALIIERDVAWSRVEEMKQQRPVAWFEKSPDLDAWFLAYSYNQKAETKPLYLAPGAQSDLNLSCKSVQERLATQWGYVLQPGLEKVKK